MDPNVKASDPVPRDVEWSPFFRPDHQAAALPGDEHVRREGQDRVQQVVQLARELPDLLLQTAHAVRGPSSPIK